MLLDNEKDDGFSVKVNANTCCFQIHKKRHPINDLMTHIEAMGVFQSMLTPCFYMPHLHCYIHDSKFMVSKGVNGVYCEKKLTRSTGVNARTHSSGVFIKMIFMTYQNRARLAVINRMVLPSVL